jgi:hypothetical protein
MAQWILKANGNVVPRRSHRPLKTEEVHSEQERMKQKVFDALIKRRWGTPINPSITKDTEDPDNGDNAFEAYEDDDEQARIISNIEDAVDANGQLLNQMPAYDRILNSEVSLQTGEEMSVGKVTQRALGPDGTVAGTYDENPFLNTMIYEVEFPNGDVKEYAANIITENMLTQVDSDGYSLTTMKGIINYKPDDVVAIPKSDMYVVTSRGQKKMRKTTIGWKLLVQWADDSESWVALKDMKESHPVKLAEGAKARAIADEPAFLWWVPYTLRKRDVIMSNDSQIRNRGPDEHRTCLQSRPRKWQLPMARRARHGNDGNWSRLRSFGGWPECTAYMEDGLRTSGLGPKNGLHEEGKMGT